MIEASVKFFLQRLDDLLLHDPETFLGLRDRILRIKSILSEKIWFFEDINRRIGPDDGVALVWIHDLRATIHSIDDCLDEFVVQMEIQSGSDPTALITQFGTQLEKIIEDQLDEIMSRMPGNCEQIAMEDEESKLVDEGMASSSSSSKSDNNILPYYLHSCLIYCCIFPENYKIPQGRLVRLLVAEGLVQERPGETMEDIAKENIENLVSLGLLNVVEKNLDQRTRLQIHPQIRVLLRRKIEEEGFIASFISVGSRIAPNSRRLSIHDDPKNIPTPDLMNDLRIRSLFMFGINERLSEGEFDSLRSVLVGVKLLRVLDLEDIKIRSLPDEVGHLIHLRYLGVKKSDIEELPESLGNLRNLQTLDIRWNGKLEQGALPIGILNLINLRHLKMFKNHGVCGMLVPLGIGRLQSLQTITGLHPGEGIAQELGFFNELRRLGVMDLTEDVAIELWVSISKMERLLTLSLEAKHCGREAVLPSLEPFSPPPLIRKLRLEGRLENIPKWFGLMGNLTKLRLGFTHLSEDPSCVLQFLPNLKHLTLWHAYDGKQIGKEFCQPGGFLKLEFLTIASFVLEEWIELEEGALPSLKHLHLHSCLKLRMLPEGLQNVTTLQQLNLIPLLDEHEERLRSDGGQENYKIKNIPQITFITTSMVNQLAHH